MDAEEFELGQRVYIMTLGRYGEVEEIHEDDNSLTICVEGSSTLERVYAWNIDASKDYRVVERVYRMYYVRANSREEAIKEASMMSAAEGQEYDWEILDAEEDE